MITGKKPVQILCLEPIDKRKASIAIIEYWLGFHNTMRTCYKALWKAHNTPMAFHIMCTQQLFSIEARYRSYVMLLCNGIMRLRDPKWAFIAFRQYFLWDMRAPQTYRIAFWIRSMSFWYQIIFIFFKSQYNTNFMTNYKNLIFFKFLIYNSPRSKLYKSNDIFLKCM